MRTSLLHDDGLGAKSTLAVVTVGALVSLVLGALVVNDYVRVDAYEGRYCSGALVASDIHQSGIKCARGKAVTTFGPTPQVASYNQSVELFYPPVNWLIVCKKSSEVEDWLAGLASATVFRCLVDQPSEGTGLPDGVRTNYDQIGGWVALLVFSSLFFAALLVGGLYLLCTSRR